MKVELAGVKVIAAALFIVSIVLLVISLIPLERSGGVLTAVGGASALALLSIGIYKQFNTARYFALALFILVSVIEEIGTLPSF